MNAFAIEYCKKYIVNNIKIRVDFCVEIGLRRSIGGVWTLLKLTATGVIFFTIGT